MNNNIFEDSSSDGEFADEKYKPTANPFSDNKQSKKSNVKKSNPFPFSDDEEDDMEDSLIVTQSSVKNKKKIGNEFNFSDSEEVDDDVQHVIPGTNVPIKIERGINVSALKPGAQPLTVSQIRAAKGLKPFKNITFDSLYVCIYINMKVIHCLLQMYIELMMNMKMKTFLSQKWRKK